MLYFIMASKKKRKGNDGQPVNDEKYVNDIVRMVLDNVHKKQREKNIRDIAHMVVENNNEKNILKLARMVVENNPLNRQQLAQGNKNNYKIDDHDIHEIVRLVKANENIHVPRSVFFVEPMRTHERFNYTEFIYDVNIGSENTNTLPEFFTNLRQVFEYLINTMKYHAGLGTFKAQFYISNAPRTPFSTAVLNVDDFNTEMFFNIFERHMQSNAQQIINNGWHTVVSLYIFPNLYTPHRKNNKNPEQKCALYKKFGKNNAELGSGKKHVATKHGREVRHSVFQIGKSGVKNGCFALALLVGKSFLQNDAIYYKLERDRNLKLTELYTDNVITNVYTCSNVRVGPVRIDQLHLFYENYLKPMGIDLVVFSKAQADSIVYDSRLDENGELHRITKVLFFFG